MHHCAFVSSKWIERVRAAPTCPPEISKWYPSNASGEAPKSEEWLGDMLQFGDIVEELRIGSLPNSMIRFKAPFKKGKSGVNKILQDSCKKKDTSIAIRIHHGPREFTELHACIILNDRVAKLCTHHSTKTHNTLTEFIWHACQLTATDERKRLGGKQNKKKK
ncbi:hypothetical protein K1719_033332 [Acacia pycnantha]|nr:hypothetical protein K1719_033332 [Acacia pycnantha]